MQLTIASRDIIDTHTTRLKLVIAGVVGENLEFIFCGKFGNIP